MDTDPKSTPNHGSAGCLGRPFGGVRPTRTANRALIWGRFEVDLGSIWGRFGVALGSIWGRFGISLGSIRGRFGVDLGSLW